MEQSSIQKEDQPQVFTPQFPWKIIAGILVFLILVLLGFNFALDRYGKFWEKGTISRVSPVPTPSVTTQSPVKLSCPFPAEFCQQGRELDAGEAFFGLGFNLPVGTVISAPFTGLLEETKEPNTPPEQTRLTLKDSQGKEALFVFYGTASVPSGTEVSVGQEIGKIGQGQFPAVAPFIGLNLSFSFKENGKFQKVSLN